MLDNYIIAELLKQEQEKREDAERPTLELPLYNPADEEAPVVAPVESDRGVVVIEY
jgi:hypothetical protein